MINLNITGVEVVRWNSNKLGMKFKIKIGNEFFGNNIIKFDGKWYLIDNRFYKMSTKKQTRLSFEKCKIIESYLINHFQLV